MSVVQNILFPTDGSESSKKALDYIKELASKFQTKVVVLNTYELPLILNGYEMNPDIFEQLSKDYMERAEKIVQETKSELEKSATMIETVVLEGSSGSLIIDVAKDKNCDLIVMGRRGLGSVKSFLLGSVSNYVIHHSKYPVLLVQ